MPRGASSAAERPSTTRRRRHACGIGGRLGPTDAAPAWQRGLLALASLPRRGAQTLGRSRRAERTWPCARPAGPARAADRWWPILPPALPWAALRLSTAPTTWKLRLEPLRLERSSLAVNRGKTKSSPLEKSSSALARLSRKIELRGLRLAKHEVIQRLRSWPDGNGRLAPSPTPDSGAPSRRPRRCGTRPCVASAPPGRAARRGVPRRQPAVRSRDGGRAPGAWLRPQACAGCW